MKMGEEAKLTICIPDDVLDNATQYAIENNTTVSSLIKA